MSLTKSAAAATALCLMLGATDASAQTSESPSAIGCLHMDKKVAAALDANQQSPNFSTARDQARSAQSFCMRGLYKNGISSYSKALAMLGVS